jgi:alanine racemase
MRPTDARILLSNLVTNYLNIRKKVFPVKILAVMKADAYGHGVKGVIETLVGLGNEQPDYYGVAIAEEGEQLRLLGVTKPILLFESVSERNIQSIIDGDLVPTVFEYEHLRLIRRFAKTKPLKVQVKVNTGMNRLGIDYQAAVEFISVINSEKNHFILDGIYTHFSTADDADKSFTLEQNRRFKSVLDELKKRNIPYGVAHAANSGATLDMPETYYDMVRPGILLYGYYPSNETSESVALKPVMEVVSEVASCKKVKADEPISYGRTYYTQKETNIVTVPIGYADGFSRALSNKASVIIDGALYPVVGKVTMDRIMVEVGDKVFPIGTEVVLLGQRGDLKITAWDWAKILETIPYEITCTFSKRMPREYI